MDAQASRKYIIQWLQQVNDVRILKELESLARSHQEGDWWQSTSEAAKASILQGHQEYMNGKGIPHDEAKQILKKRLGF